MRDCVMPSGSAAANSRAMTDQDGDNPSLRARGYTQASVTMPAITAGRRQPKARLPKRMMPAAMANLPISGCGHETSSPASQRSGGLGFTRPSTMAFASFA